MYENYKYGNFDKLESAIDDALNQARKHRKKIFGKITSLNPVLPNTAKTFSSPITVENKALSKKQVLPNLIESQLHIREAFYGLN